MAKFISVFENEKGKHKTLNIPDDKLHHYEKAPWMKRWIQVSETEVSKIVVEEKPKVKEPEVISSVLPEQETLQPEVINTEVEEVVPEAKKRGRPSSKIKP